MAKKKYATRSAFMTRRQAAILLGVIPPTLDKLAAIHGLTIRQIPGHSRRYFVRDEIEALFDKSKKQSCS